MLKDVCDFRQFHVLKNVAKVFLNPWEYAKLWQGILVWKFGWDAIKRIHHHSTFL